MNSHHSIRSICIWVETHLMDERVIHHRVERRGNGWSALSALHQRHTGATWSPRLTGNVGHIWYALTRHHHWNYWHAIRSKHLTIVIGLSVFIHVTVPTLIMRTLPLPTTLAVTLIVMAISITKATLSSRFLIDLATSSTVAPGVLVRMPTLPIVHVLHAELMRTIVISTMMPTAFAMKLFFIKIATLR